jgi:alkane 1-monooxygenase
VQLHHSWNSDHVLSRIILFELTRHADHHYRPAKKYQALKSWQVSPQLPAGYPGSMLLAFVPPLWFRVVNKRLDTCMQGVDVAVRQKMAA